MRDLVRKNNVDKAADMAITILSVVDDNDKLKQDETVRCMSIANGTFLVKITGVCGVRMLAMDTNSAKERYQYLYPHEVIRRMNSITNEGTISF